MHDGLGPFEQLAYTVAVVHGGATSPNRPSAASVTLTLNARQVATVVAVGCLNPGTAPCTGGQPFALTTRSDN
ncbi:MAG TPA: hypothetical protein VMU33_17565 [Burkholderiaceae bacterium]|nr:hypothetical protein [Burkholderiaceae bacterium]